MVQFCVLNLVWKCFIGHAAKNLNIEEEKCEQKCLLRLLCFLCLNSKIVSLYVL